MALFPHRFSQIHYRIIACKLNCLSLNTPTNSTSPVFRTKLIGQLFLVALFSLTCIVPNLFAQTGKQVEQYQQIWYVYQNTLQLNKKWGIVSELQERHFISPTAQHQSILRFQAVYILGSGWEGGPGIAFPLSAQNDPNITPRLNVPELRPFLGLTLKQKTPIGTVSHRYKAEARFFHNIANGELTNGYTFGNFRIRYQLGIEIPLIKSTQKQRELLSLKISDEVHINLGKKIVHNVFDQNRLYIGFIYKILPDLSVEAGYLNWFQQKTSGEDFYKRHVLRLGMAHKISLSH